MYFWKGIFKYCLSRLANVILADGEIFSQGIIRPEKVARSYLRISFFKFWARKGKIKRDKNAKGRTTRQTRTQKKRPTYLKTKSKSNAKTKKNHEKMQRQNINQIKHKDEIQILNTITKYKGVHLHRTVDKIAPIWARRCRTGAWGGWWYAGKRSALVLWLWLWIAKIMRVLIMMKQDHLRMNVAPVIKQSS